MKVKMRTPRSRRTATQDIDGRRLVGEVADLLAAHNAYGAGPHTLACEGRILDRRDPVGRHFFEDANVELVVR